jgi:indole-3-glycerol phosphate synthase
VILDEIIRHKRVEIRRSKNKKSLKILKQEVARLPQRTNRFLVSLKNACGIAVIAEIKRRSPSQGMFCKNFDAVKIAKQYERSGATALSVLTDQKYFGGSAKIFKEVKKTSSLPVLRKDFTVDEYQIYESRLLNADAILLIARALSVKSLAKFYSVAKKLGLETLFEVHDDKDLQKVLGLKPLMIGINNRDLASFRVDLNVTRLLAVKVPRHCLLVSESGITSAEDLAWLKKYRVRAVLVGETLMKSKKPGSALKRLLVSRHGSR